MLGALTQDGSVVEMWVYFPSGERFKVRHRASLGIAVVQEYWNTGLGTVLINGAIDLARKAGYEQLELGVFSDNSSALHLYQKLGFQEVGKNAQCLQATGRKLCGRNYDGAALHKCFLM